MKVILAVWEVFGDELTDEHMNRLELIFTPKNIPPKVKNSKMGLNNIFLGHPVVFSLLVQSIDKDQTQSLDKVQTWTKVVSSSLE